ncbi:RNA helicase [Coemansia sp. RSA 552]|nr:RNA helicase [Coemansia sp. RSA 552]
MIGRGAAISRRVPAGNPGRLLCAAYHATARCDRGKSSKTKKIEREKKREGKVAEVLGRRVVIGDRLRSIGQLTKRAEPTWPQDVDIDEAFARKTRDKALLEFPKRGDVYRRCAYFGISRPDFEEWVYKYIEAGKNDQIERLQPEALISLLIRGRNPELESFLINQFISFLAREAPHVVKDIRYLREITDMRNPQEWAMDTRKMHRRIIMHVGPTNSGKTYHALKRLEEARSGIYCSPLRLLAHEIYDRMTRQGISCGLITGEDRRMPDFEEGCKVAPMGYTVNQRPMAQLISCTVEMAQGEYYNVAVVDEIQMIADSQRGWAWTGALLSLKAQEIHLCGEPSAVPLVKRLCAAMDEEVEVREYSRLSGLETSKKSLDNRWNNVKPGDCVVAFSRAGIYRIKETIERETGMRCAVIYGGLPPESRVEQARLFNDPDSGYDVLVASDAVGMGINLSIKRVVFTGLEKFDGQNMAPISVSQTRQIGGRAGRYKTGTSTGVVTTMDARDLPALGRSMNRMPPGLNTAGIKPTPSMIEMFSHQFPRVPFSQLWTMFKDVAHVGKDYFLCSFHDQERIASIVEDIPLSITERYQLLYAPLNTRDEYLCNVLRSYAKAISEKRECIITDVITLPQHAPTTRDGIGQLEMQHRAITMYLWMSYHFLLVFVDRDGAFHLKAQCEKMIQDGLSAVRPKENRRFKPPSARPGVTKRALLQSLEQYQASAQARTSASSDRP